MVITQIGRKKVGGHLACLGDIARNISKMGDFCTFSEGAWGEFDKSWLKSNKFQSFRLILPIVFTFEQPTASVWYFGKQLSFNTFKQPAELSIFKQPAELSFRATSEVWYFWQKAHELWESLYS